MKRATPASPIWTFNDKRLIQGISDQAVALLHQQGGSSPVLAGVSPGQGNQMIAGIPVFDLVDEAIAQVGSIETSVIFSPPHQVLDAALEAIAVGIRQLVIQTRHVPPLDLVQLFKIAQSTQTIVLGPGSRGVVSHEAVPSPGITPTPANVIGIISTIDSISDDMMGPMPPISMTPSRLISLGDAPLIGSSFCDWLGRLEADPHVGCLVLIGQPNYAEALAIAQTVHTTITKPTLAYFVGFIPGIGQRHRHSPPAIAPQLVESRLTHRQQKSARHNLEQASIKLARRPSQIVDWLADIH